MRKDNAGLDSNYHEQDKLITQLKTRLAVLEQEVKDKEEVKRKTNDLYSSEQEQKVHEQAKSGHVPILFSREIQGCVLNFTISC